MSNTITLFPELVSSRSMRSAVSGSLESVTVLTLCADGKGFGDESELCDADFLEELRDNGAGVTRFDPSRPGTSFTDLSVLTSSSLSS